MVRAPTILGMIPARGGSKRLPRKNIASVGGRPLIGWTIAAALESGALDRIVTSTEDEEIAQVARSLGSEIPFLRPQELAGDSTSSMDVVLHMINELRDRGAYLPEYLMLLQPTSPLRNAQDIRNVAEMAITRNADAVVSVSALHRHPDGMKTITADGRLKPFLTDLCACTRAQDLPPIYTLNGALYLARTRLLLAGKGFVEEYTYAYEMPVSRSIDIDSAWDLYLADLIIRHGLQNGPHPN